MAQHFGDMLVSRRRQMGVSLQQVANAIKIRPQIIEYFETENFAAMPPRGYAQGMISSYARYLGLNPRQVVDAYFDALNEFEHTGRGRAGRFQEAASDANPRGARMPGRYEVREPERPNSRFAQRPPQAGYVSESASPHEPVSASRLRSLSASNRRQRPAANGYDPNLRSRTTRDYRGEAPSMRPRQGGSDMRARRGGAPAPRGGYAGQRGGYPSQHPTNARRDRGSYYGGGDPRGNTRGRGGSRQSSGSFLSQLPVDPKILIAGIVMLLVIIVLAAMLFLRGGDTTQSDTSSDTTTDVKAATTNNDDDTSSDSDDDSSSSSSDDASSNDSKTDATTTTEPEETTVKVEVAEEGIVAWIEVKLDGKSVLGKQVVGPFEQEYTVTSQIDITTDTPNEVVVYKNGEKVRYDTKVSGVAKVSISAPKVETVDLTVDTDDDGIADMTAEDAKNEGYDVEARTVTTVTIPKSEYAYASSSTDSSTDSSSDSTDEA